MKNLFRPLVLSLILSALGLGGCESDSGTQSQTAPVSGIDPACYVDFSKTIEPLRLNGGRHFYFNPQELAFLDDPAFIVERVVLQTVLRGRYKGSAFEVPLAINGLQAVMTNGSSIYELIRYNAAADSSAVAHKLHKMAVNGGMSVRGFMLKAKEQKGEVKFSLQGNALFALSGVLEISGKSASACPKPSVSPDPEPSATPSPTPTFAVPQTRILSVDPHGALVASGSISLVFESDQIGVSFYCALDGAEAVLCESPQVYSGLSSGAHLFKVYAQNAAGLTDPVGATHQWSVDLIAPQFWISNLAALSSLTSNDSIAFELGADEPGAVFSCRLDGGVLSVCSSPVSYSGLADGLHRFELFAADALGNQGEGSADFQWVIDRTGPNVFIVQADPAERVTARTTMNVSFAADESARFECSLDHAAFAACVSPWVLSSLSQGLHQVEVRAVDLAGNQGVAASYSWAVDLTAPKLSLGNVQPAVGSLSNAGLISVEFFADEAAQFSCAFDGGTSETCSSPFSVPVLSDGNHELVLRAKDEAGNVSESLVLGWVMDSRAPVLSFGAILPSGGSYLSSDWLEAQIEASESVSLSCSLNDVELGAVSSPVRVSGLAEGAHVLVVGGTDLAGNAASVISHSFSVDRTAPVVELVSFVGSVTHETSNTFVFTASEASSFECNLNGIGFAACTSPLQISGFADGLHVFEVRASDLAGNLGVAALVSWTVDLTAPVVDLVVTRPANADIVFGFSADEAGSWFECSLDGAAFAACSSPLSYSGLAVGDHSFVVRAIDALGNSDPAGVSHVWTVEPLPTTQLDSVSPASTFTNQRQITFGFSSDVGVGFVCSLDGSPQQACVTGISYVGLADGAHSFAVFAVDRWGTQDALGASYSWTVDAVAPVVISISHSYTRTSVTINWITSEPATQKVNWGLGTDTSRIIPDNGVYSTSHSVTITGLSPNTQYAYIVSGKDRAGNSYQYAKRAFRTNP